MAGLKTTHTTQTADDMLDDAALEQVDGGRLPPTEPAHHLSWSEVLTDPNMAVPFDPAVPPSPPLQVVPSDTHSDHAKPGDTIVCANW